MALTLVEQIDERLIQIYFEQGIKIIRDRWLIGQNCDLFLKYGEGISYRTKGRKTCTTSDTNEA